MVVERSPPPRSAQQVQQVQGRWGLQVLPGPSPGCIADTHVGVKLVHQETHHLLVAVYGSQVQWSVAAPRPCVDLHAQTRLAHSVPAGKRPHARMSSAGKVEDDRVVMASMGHCHCDGVVIEIV